jgi:polyhydroxyalkanoate synthesis regulator phasin
MRESVRILKTTEENMKKTLKKMTAVVAGLVAMTFAAVAQDSGALVDALVKKGILSDQEAEEIRADLTKEFSQTPAGKLNLSSSVTQLRIYGDARVRYQWENKTDQTGSSAQNGNADRSRYRYRVRLGAEYALTDKFKTGIRLETSKASDSTNNNYGGYFDKNGDEAYIGLAFLEYDDTSSAPFGIADNFNVRLGKHQSPFMLSQAWWDSDINPEGLSERIGWKDVGVKGLDVSLIGGQYIVSEENNSSTFGSIGQVGGGDDGFLFVGQSKVDYSFTNKSKLSIAPMFIVESQGTFNNQENGSIGTSITNPGGTASVSTTQLDNENSTAALGNLFVLALPVEYTWKMFNLPNKVYGTYGHNLEGNRRLKDVGVSNATIRRLAKGGQNSFWNVGYDIGENKKKGDWKAGVEYRWVEAGAYTTNLSDSDFAKNEFNQQGVVVNVTYNFTDFLTGSATWMHSNDIDQGIDVSTSDAATVDLLQLDVSWRF